MAAIYGEERVNYYTNDHQYGAQVAVLAGGGYVVSWVSRGQDGSDDGIYAQRYNSVGMPVGAEFRVNSATANAQIQPTIVGLSDGGFVVAWSDQYADGSSWGVFAQRYDAHGVARGSQFLVNQTTLYDQGTPAIAAVDGGFVVTWASQYQDDGGSYGVYARRYANDGSPSGAEFAVNSTVSGNQNEPAIAAFDGGGFVVVWRSDSQDGSSAGVYGQRYDAAGVAAGGEFRVNETTAGGQYQPDVSAIAGGGFAVSWYNENYDVSGTGSYQDVYVREYAGDGTALTGQLKANTPTASQSSQSEPAIASLGSGNYVVVWRSDGQDGSQSGVYQQLFGDAAELPRQASPSLGDFAGTLTFGENLVNATPQIIDPAVSLLDLDSANLDGGRVEIFYTQFGSAEDQLGVRNQGTGVAQIGVSGSTVSYNDGSGAVAIGTLSGGTNGSMLAVNLNATNQKQYQLPVIERP